MNGAAPVAIVVAGGFVVAAVAGTLARAALAGALNRPRFPIGTVAVNVVGSFVLGLLHSATPEVVTVVGTGGLGAFTTFSTFSRDVAVVGREEGIAPAVAYVALSAGLTVAAAWAGLHVAP